MDKKTLQSFSYTMPGVALLVVGAILIMMKDTFIFSIIDIIVCILIFNGLFELFHCVFKRNLTMFLLALLKIFGGIVLKAYNVVPVHLLIQLFGIYIIFTAIIKLITFYLERKDHIKGSWIYFIDGLFLILVGISYFVEPLIHSQGIFLLLGIYVLILGYTYIRDGIEILVPHSHDHLKRKIRVHLPVILEVLIPYNVLKRINHLLEVDDTSINMNKKDNEISDIDVYVHVSEDGFGTVGHVDIGYNGKIISYGSYDYESYKLKGLIGDGVLMIVDKDKYIPFCKKYRNKTLFCFGIRLNDLQKKCVDQKINELLELLIPFQCKYALDSNITLHELDYASLLYKHTGASLYKFKKTRFKTYFGLSTNCVLLVDSILGKAGIDSFTINGIITPGTYYDYLEKEYQKEEGLVISKTIYN